MKPSSQALPPSSRGINCYPLLMMMIASWLLDSVFTRNEMERIRRISLWDVIVNATGVPPDAIQRRVFVWQDGDPCPQPFQLNSTLLESCVPLQRYDYFEVIDPGGRGPLSDLVNYPKEIRRFFTDRLFFYPYSLILRANLRDQQAFLPSTPLSPALFSRSSLCFECNLRV